MPNEPSTPASYLTVNGNLKHILDRVENIETNKETKKKEVASIVTLACDVPALKGTLVRLLSAQGLVDLDEAQQKAAGVVLNGLKTFAVSVNDFSTEKLEVIVAGEGRTKSTTEAFDKFVKPKVSEELVKAIKASLDRLPAARAAHGDEEQPAD